MADSLPIDNFVGDLPVHVVLGASGIDLNADGNLDSSTYPYSIGYPANWKIRPADHPLTQDELFFEESPGVDYFSATAPDLSWLALVVVGPTVPAGTTLKEWVAVAVRQLHGHGCQPPESGDDVRLEGKPAELFTVTECSSFVMWAAVVHGDHAFHVIWVDDGANGDEAAQAADRVLFDKVLASFTSTS